MEEILKIVREQADIASKKPRVLEAPLVDTNLSLLNKPSFDFLSSFASTAMSFGTKKPEEEGT
jgi:hypothetical protein